MPLESRASLVEFATSPEVPPLYRLLYGWGADDLHRIETEAQWRALPALSRDVLARTSIDQRLFIRRDGVDTIYASSGTTSLPLFGYRSYTGGPEYRSAFHDFRGACLSSIILPHMTEIALSAIHPSIRVIALDPKRMRASVALAKAAGVDSVLVHTFLMPLLCEHLRSAGVAEHIRFVEIAGEPCSRSVYELIRRELPNAVIVPVYGAREIEGPIGVPCKAMDGSDPLEVYHANPEMYLEIVDEHGDVIEPARGVEGDIVITAGTKNSHAFPLIRYRIGDTIRVVQERCAHGTWSFTVVGRTQLDFLKIPGGIIRADIVQHALERLEIPEPHDFLVEYSEVAAEESVLPHITVRLHLGERNANDTAESIARELRVSPAYTYADGVRDGAYAPLSCAPLKDEALHGAKRRRIIKL